MDVERCKLDKEGCHLSFVNGHWEVIKGTLIVTLKKKRMGLYIWLNNLVTEKKSSYEVNVVADKIRPTILWHRDLVIWVKRVWRLISKRNDSELKNVKVKFGDPCVFEKNNIFFFTKSGRTLKYENLDIVYKVIYGTIIIASLGGFHRYVWTMFDIDQFCVVLYKVNGSPVMTMGDVFMKIGGGVILVGISWEIILSNCILSFIIIKV